MEFNQDGDSFVRDSESPVSKKFNLAIKIVCYFLLKEKKVFFFLVNK